MRQGHPISPTLFVVFFDLLARILTKVESNGVIHSVKISRTSPAISNLMFANDLTIFCRANENEAPGVLGCLQRYCEWFSQLLNFSKSSIHFSNNVQAVTRRKIYGILPMRACNHKSSHLGLPFCKGSSLSKAFAPVIEKLKSKLGGWKARVLSQAGRSVLIKTMAQSIPMYTMQSFMLPKHICNKIVVMVRDFW